jgi:hypothetical protein
MRFAPGLQRVDGWRERATSIGELMDDRGLRGAREHTADHAGGLEIAQWAYDEAG